MKNLSFKGWLEARMGEMEQSARQGEEVSLGAARGRVQELQGAPKPSELDLETRSAVGTLLGVIWRVEV